MSSKLGHRERHAWKSISIQLKSGLRSLFLVSNYKKMTKNITVEELNRILKEDDLSNFTLVDVRTNKENKSLRIEQAINIPLSALEEKKKELEKYDTVFVHCRTGGRSEKACHVLNELGLSNVINVTGGILEWEEAGFDLARSNHFHLSILRQVHIIAGLMVLIGSVLAYFVQLEWVLLSGFVGLGLFIAGLTGWCGMGELLARMPWNK